MGSPDRAYAYPRKPVPPVIGDHNSRGAQAASASLSAILRSRLESCESEAKNDECDDGTENEDGRESLVNPVARSLRLGHNVVAKRFLTRAREPAAKSLHFVALIVGQFHCCGLLRLLTLTVGSSSAWLDCGWLTVKESSERSVRLALWAYIS